jgi:hypothetical protein
VLQPPGSLVMYCWVAPAALSASAASVLPICGICKVVSATARAKQPCALVSSKHPHYRCSQPEGRALLPQIRHVELCAVLDQLVKSLHLIFIGS